MTDVPPLWFDDPAGDGDLRFWNGTGWTDQVLVDGETHRSALQAVADDPTPSEHEREIRYQVQHEAKVLPRSTGGETLDSARVLVVNHKASWHLPRADYRLMDDAGRLLGRAKRKNADALVWIRANTMLDHHLRLELEVLGRSGELIATLDRRRFLSAAAVHITDAGGVAIGSIALEKRSRPPRLRILVEDRVVAVLEAADNEARSISISSPDGETLGRVEKTALTLGEGVLTSAQRFVLDRSTTPGSDVHRLLGFVPLALDLILGSTYDYEKERQLKHDPRMAKLDR